MEKINLNVTVSIDLAMKILAVMKENEIPETIGNLSEYRDLTPTENTENVEPTQPVATLDDVRKAFVELSKSKGKDVAKQVIADLGFKRVTEIPENMFDSVLKRVQEAI